MHVSVRDRERLRERERERESERRELGHVSWDRKAIKQLNLNKHSLELLAKCPSDNYLPKSTKHQTGFIQTLERAKYSSLSSR